MPDSSETKQPFLDNPEKTAVAVTAGILAVFGAVHELVPAHHQDTVKLLGSLDLMLNLASWHAIRRSLQTQSQEIVADEALSTQPQPEAA